MDFVGSQRKQDLVLDGHFRQIGSNIAYNTVVIDKENISSSLLTISGPYIADIANLPSSLLKMTRV